MYSPEFQVQCTHCNEYFPVGIPAPDTRGRLEPIGQISVYRISSEELRVFVEQKIRKMENEAKETYMADAKVIMQTNYVEKKDSSPHRAYAAFMLAFSENIVDAGTKSGFFERLGANDSNAALYRDVKIHIINEYGFSPKFFEDALDGKQSYKLQEYLEDNFGITEAYLKNLRYYVHPVRVRSEGSNDNWIFFAADPTRIIRDILTDPHSDKPHGKITIADVVPINKDLYDFIVHVKPYEEESEEDPFVRRMLTGDIKKKRK